MLVQLNRIAAALVMSGIASTGAQPSPTALEIPRERILVLDMRTMTIRSISWPASTGPGGLVASADVPPGPRPAGTLAGIRVHLQFSGSTAGPWIVVVKADDGRVIDQIDAARLAGTTQVWSDEVSGDVAHVELQRTSAGTSPAVTIDQYATRVIPTVQQAISGEDQRIRIGDAPLRVRRWASAIARLRFMIAGQGEATCTAFLVGTRLLLTNDHCISSEEEALSAFADFKYDLAGATPVHLRVAHLVAHDHAMDYALLQLASEPSADIIRVHFVQESAQPTDKQPLFIIEHPSGLPKQASIADCAIAGLSKVGLSPGVISDFGHTCDTLGGSSGSPVLDWNTGVVVGLHHLGFLPGQKDPVNQGVHIWQVLNKLKVQAPDAFAELIR
jgi:hypothetical protein